MSNTYTELVERSRRWFTAHSLNIPGEDGASSSHFLKASLGSWLSLRQLLSSKLGVCESLHDFTCTCTAVIHLPSNAVLSEICLELSSLKSPYPHCHPQHHLGCIFLPGQKWNNSLDCVRVSGKDLQLWREICGWEQRLQQPKMNRNLFSLPSWKSLTENETDGFGAKIWWDFKCPSGLK